MYLHSNKYLLLVKLLKSTFYYACIKKG